MKKLLVVLGILLVGFPSWAFAQDVFDFSEEDYSFSGSAWKGQIAEVRWNPQDFPDWFSVPHSVTTPLGNIDWIMPDYPSPVFNTEEEKTAWRMDLFESLLRKQIDSINNIPDSALRVHYKGRTTLPCDTYTKGVIVYCFRETQIGASVLFTFGLTGRGETLGARVAISAIQRVSETYVETKILEGLIRSVGITTGQKVEKGLGLGAYNSAVIAHIYPFDKNCTVSLSGDGVLELPYVWVGDEMYRATLRFNFGTGYFELLSGDIQEHPVSECGFKYLEADGTIHIPYAWYESKIPGEKGTYFLNLKLMPPEANALSFAPALTRFSIVSYGVK